MLKKQPPKKTCIILHEEVTTLRNIPFKFLQLKRDFNRYTHALIIIIHG